MAEPTLPAAPSNDRVTVASTFASMLIALAYSEMVQPVKASVVTEGFTVGTSLLATVFFLTTIRVWIGNEMFLRNPLVVAQAGPLWLFDFMVVVIESMIFVFLATTCSETAARQSRVGFVGLLLILYAVDILWVLSMWCRRLFGKAPWKIPWWWAGQNFLLIILMLLLRRYWGDFSAATLVCLTVLHVAAFINSVVFYDHAGLLSANRRKPRRREA